jgi:hypothetical protein
MPQIFEAAWIDCRSALARENISRDIAQPDTPRSPARRLLESALYALRAFDQTAEN